MIMNKIRNHTTNSEVSALLVLRHRTNSVGIVQGVNQFGNLIDVQPERSGVDTVMQIDSSADSFMDFYTDFYHQLKNPAEYSFFKVREFEAQETARGLQDYIDGFSDVQKQDLKEFEVSIETVDAIRNRKYRDRESSLVEYDFNTDSSVIGNNSQYRFQIEDIPWESLAEMGLDREQLGNIGALESLLKGYKTPMLIPISLSDGDSLNTVDARLQLRLDGRGEVVVRIYRVIEKPNFRERFLDHEFTKEDQMHLVHSGNMGRVVGLTHPWTGEVIPSLVSMDRLTNELISLRMEFVRIPAVICGVTLNLEQVKILRDGKSLFIENMLSKRGRLFSATVQFSAEKQGVEFLFNKNLKGFDGSGVQANFEKDVPTVFRGKYLRKWQMDKLRAGETAYINGLSKKDGKKYQGYMSFDAMTGKIEFSFKNPKKK